MFTFYDKNFKRISENYFIKYKNYPDEFKVRYYINDMCSYLKLSTMMRLNLISLKLKLNNIDIRYFNDIAIYSPSYLLLFINYDEFLTDNSYCLNNFGSLCKVKIYNGIKYYKMIGCDYYYTTDDNIKFIPVLDIQKNSFYTGPDGLSYVDIFMKNYSKFIKQEIDGYFVMYKIPLVYNNPPISYYCPLISHYNY